MIYQPLTVTIKIKTLQDVHNRLYFTRVTKFYLVKQNYNLVLINCNTNLMRQYANNQVSTYTAIVNLDNFSIN